MSAQTKQGNFLSRLIENDEREHVRRDTKQPCKLIYLKSGLRGHATLPGIMVNISEGGALIQMPIGLKKGRDIYLLLKNFPFKVAAVVVNVTDKGHHIKFADNIPPENVIQIASGRPFRELGSV